MSLGICAVDETEQVVMTDGSALPQAEGEGGIARVFRTRESSRTTMPAPVFDSIKSPTSFESSFNPDEDPQLFFEEPSSSVELAESTDTLTMRLYEDSPPLRFESPMLAGSESMAEYAHMWDIDEFESNEVEDKREVNTPKAPVAKGNQLNSPC